MPKLPTAQARRVAKAESSGGSSIIPDGEYKGKLLSCKVSPKLDRNKNSYWIWEFELTEDGEYKGTKLRVNTGLAENQEWFMKIVFDAFEAKPNTDTDTLVGKEVILIVEQGEIQGGARKGQIRSQITSMLPLSSQDEDGDDDFDDDDGDDDDFDDDDS